MNELLNALAVFSGKLHTRTALHRRLHDHTMGVVSKPLIIDNIFFNTECLALNKSTRGPDLPQYCLNCTKFGTLIVRKIIKIAAATRCHTLRLKCMKFDLGWSSAPHPAYSAPQTPSWI